MIKLCNSLNVDIDKVSMRMKNVFECLTLPVCFGSQNERKNRVALLYQNIFLKLLFLFKIDKYKVLITSAGSKEKPVIFSKA